MATRESSHARSLSSIVKPTGEGVLCKLVPLLPQQEEERFSPWLEKAQPITDYHNSANKKTLSFELPVYSSEFFVGKSPSQLPFPCPFLCERGFLSFVLCTCLWFCNSLCVPHCNFLLFPNRPIFVGKITNSFIFKVNKVSECLLGCYLWRIAYCPSWPLLATPLMVILGLGAKVLQRGRALKNDSRYWGNIGANALRSTCYIVCRSIAKQICWEETKDVT